MKTNKIIIIILILEIICWLMSSYMVLKLYFSNEQQISEEIITENRIEELESNIDSKLDVIITEDLNSYILEYQDEKEELKEEIVELKQELQMLRDRFSHITVSYFTFEQLCKLPEKYTVDDLRYLCTTVFWECGLVTGDVEVTFYTDNQAQEVQYLDAQLMQKLTAQVLLNRTLYDERFPDTIYENVVRPGQYTVTYTYESKTLEAYNKYPTYWKTVVENCLVCMNEEFDIPHNVIFQSNYNNLGKSYYAVIYVSYLRSTSYYAYG